MLLSNFQNIQAIGHEALYNQGDEDYQKAEIARDRIKQSEKQALVNENIKLKGENAKLLEKNAILIKEIEHLKKEKEESSKREKYDKTCERKS